MYGGYIPNNPALLDATHKLFLMQMLSGKLKLLDVVVRLHQWLFVLRLHLTDGKKKKVTSITTSSTGQEYRLCKLTNLEDESLKFRSSLSLMSLVSVQ